MIPERLVEALNDARRMFAATELQRQVFPSPHRWDLLFHQIFVRAHEPAGLGNSVSVDILRFDRPNAVRRAAAAAVFRERHCFCRQ